MKILSINSGSSSLKFQLFAMPEEKLLLKGFFERIGEGENVLFNCEYKEEKFKRELMFDTHQQCVDYLLWFLVDEKIISSLEELGGIGHRVAHGGEYFKGSALINQDVKKKIRILFGLAPLHNPVNLVGIESFEAKLPNVKQVAVFDTSFHQTIEPEYYLYPLPYELYQEDRIRKYGFHGTSHQYVSTICENVVNEKFGKKDLKIISCHLGNGASICAINHGKSIDTSMGFTPLAGLMMGTRCGDIDPSIVTYLQLEKGFSAEEVNRLMNNQSGFLGVSGKSNDSRDIMRLATEKDLQSELALKMFVNRIRSCIGAYAAELGGVDALIFTAGIGENSAEIRELCCTNLSFLGIEIDEEKNKKNELFIQKEDGEVLVMVIPTNEELMIVKETYKLI